VGNKNVPEGSKLWHKEHGPWSSLDKPFFSLSLNFLIIKVRIIQPIWTGCGRNINGIVYMKFLEQLLFVCIDYLATGFPLRHRDLSFVLLNLTHLDLLLTSDKA
jgi:hypothetical protein